MDASGQPVLDEQGKPKTESATTTEQVLAVGPAASQIAIKQLGTNGGGFFNVNSAHPFENPTPLSNFLRAPGYPPDSGRALLHVWNDGRGHAPGMGPAYGHDDDLLIAMLRSGPVGRAKWQSCHDRDAESIKH